MSCQEYQEQLTLYLLGDLDAGQAAQVRAHLETCAACRAAAGELERTLDLMRSTLAVSPAAPARLDAARRRKILRAKFRWWPRPWQDLAKVAAVLLVAIGILSAVLMPAVTDSLVKGKMTGALSNARSVYMAAFGKSIEDPTGSDANAAAALPRSAPPSTPGSAATTPAEVSRSSRVGSTWGSAAEVENVRLTEGRERANEEKAALSDTGVSGGGILLANAERRRESGRADAPDKKLGEMVPLRTELPKPLIVGTPTPIRVPNVEPGVPHYDYAARKGDKETESQSSPDRSKHDERVPEKIPLLGDLPVTGRLFAEARTAQAPQPDTSPTADDSRRDQELYVTGGKSRVAIQHEAVAAALPALKPPTVKLPVGGREGAQPVGTVVSSSGLLDLNGGTVADHFAYGPGAAPAEGPVRKDKLAEKKPGQDQVAVNKPGGEPLGLRDIDDDTTPASEAKPAAGQVVRGLTVDKWAADGTVAPGTNASVPAAWGYANAASGSDLASPTKSAQSLKDIAHSRGGAGGGEGRDTDGDQPDGKSAKAGEEIIPSDMRETIDSRQVTALAKTDREKFKTEASPQAKEGSATSTRKLAENEHTATKERLKEIIIPSIDLKQANIQDVAQYLSQTAGDLDEHKSGIKIEADAELKASPPITMSLRRVSTFDLIKYIAEYADADYKITDKGAVFIPKDSDQPRIERRYPLSAQLVTGPDPDIQNIQKFFEKAGIRFPAGASARYDEKKGEVVVVNTPRMLEQLESCMTTIAVAKPTEPTTKPIFRAAGVNPWVAAQAQTFSTFSISVDSASFTLARRYLNGGQRPPPESVRTEEFVNFFDYALLPPGRDLFSVQAQAARTPFCPPGVQLLKLGVKGRHVGRENRGANLTFLLDTSGSMNAPDRLELARAALKLLVAKLGPADRVALVTFSSRARLVLDFTPATEQKKILAALDGLQAAGFTHLEGGLKLAYQTAVRGFISGAANRVILMSDGVANVGAAETAELLAQVERYRKQNIFCSVFGLGTGTYDDTMLQALASQGHGTYLFMDSLDEARRVFVDELAATLNKIAADVKIQVEFNPRRVKQYRQLGYEQRQLKTEDFRNDAVAAGEVGSGQAVTALYQVELQGDVNEPLGTVRIRGRNLETGRVEELERAITAADLAPSFERADVRFRLAAAAAQFAEILRGSPYAEGTSCADVAKVLRPIALELSLDQKVQELLRLVTAAQTAPPAAE